MFAIRFDTFLFTCSKLFMICSGMLSVVVALLLFPMLSFSCHYLLPDLVGMIKDSMPVLILYAKKMPYSSNCLPC